MTEVKREMKEKEKSMNQTKLSVSNLDLYYGNFHALKNINLELPEKEITAFIGPSGCGNSTLLWAIAGLEHLSCGVIEIDGRTVQGTSPKIGFMPQRDQLFEWRNIWDNVTLGLTVRGEKDPAAYAHVSRLLERYGLASFAKKRPCQLSGGMRQRCALIRTLATEPEILLLDEPFSALDYQTRLAVSADIWRILQQEGKTALLVTHDIAEAVSMSDRVVVLSRRPAVVKAEMDMGALRGLPPLERRDTPEFHRYFNAIWKELDVHA